MNKSVGWADATVPVPQAAPVAVPGWDRRGRVGKRGGAEVLVSPAGVCVRWRLADVPAREALFGAARDAILEPRRVALRRREEAERAEARMTSADRAYAVLHASQGHGSETVFVPPEPDPRTVPGTGDWWADRMGELRAILGRRDWRVGLEAFRTAQPLAYAAMIVSLPTVARERGIAEREARMAAAREERAAERREQLRAKRASLFGSSGSGAVLPLRRFRPKVAASRPADGDRLARFRRAADEWDRRARALRVS